MRSASAKRNGLDEQRLDEGIHDYATSEHFDDRERAILRYSELMATDPDQIDAAFYTDLRTHLSDAEIVEIGLFMALNLGSHTFFSTLDFFPMFSPDGRLVSQEESRRLYGAAPVSHTTLDPESAGATAGAPAT